MSSTRPDTTDTHGITHRYGCTQPGWLGGSPLIAGVTVVRCVGCGAVRIVQPNATREARA